jgi:hypothetical protein
MQALKVVIDPFCFRQFDPANKTSVNIQCSMEEFQKRVNEIYSNAKLIDGYN